ncbi:MAG: hypothetical protein IH623_11360 [Verrucomicrobia bacterium]|nr:hypothetical protein [Verrucomicrobiota bacterium]
MQPPNYFSRIEQEARENWELLENRPEIAAPWHQLFRQVQTSVRHVVSELLQNADDAGAKSASVRIEGDTFIFAHDGTDFTAEQFASLCRFGFSNKRTLHTIGFRGVGFKSTFSLGDTVEVRTPTLAVCFKKKRFTQPIWISDARPVQRTIIRVRIQDRNRTAELRRNFEEWSESPASLLFFNTLKELAIEGKAIKRQPLHKGPVQDSSWVKLTGEESQKLLLVQSDEVCFPDEAAEEIRAERGLVAEDLHLPPCRVEIVLGLSESNRLYVVLPTGAGLDLPFSCNAPFIQDPARFAIKDPATSPTNRWLLKRAGTLAAKAMLQWLGNDDLPFRDRAEAYSLLKGAVQFAPGLDGTCSQIILESMLAEINGQRLVLTTSGKLAKTGECVAVPDELFAVWEPGQLLKLFAPGSNCLLASEVSGSVHKLRSHGWINTVDSDGALQLLEQSDNVPRPASWPQLHALWAFVQNEISHDWNNERRRRMKIVPVDGGKILHASNGVVRLSSRRDLLTPEDWKFIMDYAATLDGEWLAWISKRAPKKTPAWNEKVDPAYSLLQVLALHEPSSVDRIAAQASLRIFTGKEVALADCVRVAHIMAALGASIPEGFRYVSEALRLCDFSHGVVVDETGSIEDIVPASWAKEHLLHEDYSRNFQSCKAETWKQWSRTPGSKLLLFAPIIGQEQKLYSRGSVTRFVTARGADEPAEFHYRRDDFTVVDFGFPSDLLKHWEKLSKTDPAVWAAVTEGILTAPTHHWGEKTETDVRHNGTTYYKSLDCGFIPAEWINHLRSVPCLPDSHGKFHVPSELFLLTPETEPLRGVEPFIRLELDTERTKPLLKLLGVRDTPADADKLLSRLHTLSGMPQPLQHLPQISRFYEALDRIAVRCTPAELSPIKEAFNQKAIILTDTGEWLTSGELSIFPDEDNGSPSVHTSLRNLGLWPRIGVPERPALERTIEWLKSMESGAKVDAAAAKRVRAALQRDPVRIWNECQHWLTLDSTWVAVNDLKYRLTMQSLMKWGELFPAIKCATANLQMVSVEIAQLPPFVAIRNLGEVVEFRVTRFVESPRTGGSREWLTVLAEGLCRSKFSNDEETHRVRTVAQWLHQTVWSTFAHLDVTPYVEGAPAGEPFTPKVLWQDAKLYVAGQSTVRLYKDLADELARPFDHKQVADAVAACIDRTPEFVAEYLQAHFGLDAQPELAVRPAEAASSDSQPGADESPESKETSHETSETTGEETPAENAEDVPPGEGEDDAAKSETDDDRTEEAEPKPPTPPKPTLIEIYARQRGFRWHATEKCFTHPDGRWIKKSESPFNWEERAARGELVSRLWVTEQKLANGVEIAAELWTLFGQQPCSTTMVVVGDDHAPCALTGQELLELKNSRQITLHPARYRIVETE